MIKLGSKVTDLVTGLTGIATIRATMYDGYVQYCVNPRGKPNERLEGTFMDEVQLKVIGKGVSDLATPSDETEIQLGDAVEDKVTKTIGIVTERADYLNGCVRFVVSIEAKSPDTYAKKAKTFSAGRLSIVPQRPKVIPKKQTSARPKAGPERREHVRRG